MVYTKLFSGLNGVWHLSDQSQGARHGASAGWDLGLRRIRCPGTGPASGSRRASLAMSGSAMMGLTPADPDWCPHWWCRYDRKWSPWSQGNHLDQPGVYRRGGGGAVVPEGRDLNGVFVCVGGGEVGTRRSRSYRWSPSKHETLNQCWFLKYIFYIFVNHIFLFRDVQIGSYIACKL